MTCEQISDDLSAYLDGELTADARAAVESHLAACGACKALADELKSLTGAVAELPRYSAPAGLVEAVHERVQSSPPPLSLINGAPTGAPPVEFQQRSLWGPVAFGIAAVLMLFALAFAVMPALSNNASPTAMRGTERRMEATSQNSVAEAFERDQSNAAAEHQADVARLLKSVEKPRTEERFKAEGAAIGAAREDAPRVPAVEKEQQQNRFAAPSPAGGDFDQKMKQQKAVADARAAEPARKAALDGKANAPFADPGKPAAAAAPSARAQPIAPREAMDRVALQGGNKDLVQDGGGADEKTFTRTGGSRRSTPKPAESGTTGAPVSPVAPAAQAPGAVPQAPPAPALKASAARPNAEKKAGEIDPDEKPDTLRGVSADKPSAAKERMELKKADAQSESNRNANGARVLDEKMEGGFGGAGATGSERRLRGAPVAAQPQGGTAQQEVQQGGGKGSARELRKRTEADGRVQELQMQQPPKPDFSFRARDTQPLMAQIALLATQHGGALEKRGPDGPLGARIPAGQRAAFLKKLQELQVQYAPMEAAKAVDKAAKSTAATAQSKTDGFSAAEPLAKSNVKDADEAPAESPLIWIEILSE